MNKIYALVAITGEYEERQEEILFVCRNEAKITAKMQELQDLDKKYKAQREEVMEYRSAITTSIPPYVKDAIPKTPRGIRERDLSQEFKDNRNAILAMNHKRLNEWRHESDRFQQEKEAQVKSFCEKQGITQDTINYRGFDSLYLTAVDELQE